MQRSNTNRGILLAGVGIPGSGKSSVAREIGLLVGAEVFCEPDEWPTAVSERDKCGDFTGLSWFRSARVPGYFEADAIRSNGRTAILDSYYDKLCAHWLGAPGMEWLISPQDPYFTAAKAVAELDWILLPLADAIIVFEVDETTWHRLLKARGRALDDVFRISATFHTQHYFREAAEALAAETGVLVIPFAQEFSSPAEAAFRLVETLATAGVRII